MIFGNLFWLVITFDGLLLVILAALAMAAAPAAKPGYAWDVILWMFVLPVGLLAASIVVHTRSSALLRATALLLAASPFLVVAAAKLRDAVEDAMYQDAQGRMRYFRAGPMRDIADAVLRGDEPTVRTLAKSVKLNQYGYSEMTLLTLALIDRAEARNRITTLRTLVAAGADPNLASHYHLPLQLACVVSPEAVKLLLDAGADPSRKGPDGQPAFFHAIGLPVDRTIFPLLSAKGLDLHAVDRQGRTALDLAKLNGDEDAERLIVRQLH